jgi:cytochrome bd ubiquinol oxidase subunit I
MTFSGWVATVAGWYVTEIGRQPYLVYGVLKTADAASNVSAAMIASTFIMYMLVYISLTIAYVSVLFFMARRGGDAVDGKAVAPIVRPSRTDINPQLITRK